MEQKNNPQLNKKEVNNSYYPGKLIVLINEFFNNQQNIEKCYQNILYWESYVNHFFNKNAKYCIIMNQEGKQWVFNSGIETLPLIFKEKYCENISLISVNLSDPNEYILNSEKENPENIKYLLKINKFSKIEKYLESFVITYGILTVLFDKNLKIMNYEFQSLSHKEYRNEEESNDLLPLNDFGITPQFSRTLVISEALTEMIDSINDTVEKFELNKTSFSNEKK